MSQYVVVVKSIGLVEKFSAKTANAAKIKASKLIKNKQYRVELMEYTPIMQGYELIAVRSGNWKTLLELPH